MKRVLQFAGALIAAVSLHVASESISDRLKPAGSLCMAGEPCAAAPVAEVASGPRSGQAVYESKCQTCHASGAAGAPKLGDVAAWESRIAQGADALYAGAINGIGGMPAKGLCFDCSDDEIKAAVDYMVDNSK